MFFRIVPGWNLKACEKNRKTAALAANGLYPAACAIVILTGPSAKKLAGISGVCYNSSMEKKVYTTDEWNHTDKEELVSIILSLQENIAQMMENQEWIIEQAAMLRQQRFGRHSEKMNVIDGQISMFFNEPEAEASESGDGTGEPGFEEVVIRRKRGKKGNGRMTSKTSL